MFTVEGTLYKAIICTTKVILELNNDNSYQSIIYIWKSAKETYRYSIEFPNSNLNTECS